MSQIARCLFKQNGNSETKLEAISLSIVGVQRLFVPVKVRWINSLASHRQRVLMNQLLEQKWGGDKFQVHLTNLFTFLIRKHNSN